MIRWIYAAALVCVSLAAFAAYASDKKKAKAGSRRIPERALLCLSLFGGAAGGLAAMWVYRHKIRKGYFQAVNAVGLAWQTAVLIWLFF